MVIAPAVEAMPCHRVLGGAVALPDRRTYRRAVVGVGLWLGAPLLLARLLGVAVNLGPLHALERWWARGVSRHLAIQLDVSGLEHIDPTEPYIVTPLHEGFADVLALLQLPLDLRFVARDELFEWPYFGGLLRDTGQVKICPEQGAASYSSSVARPRDPGLGESLVVFPQGSILGIEIDFKRWAVRARPGARSTDPADRPHRRSPGLGASVLATAALRPAGQSPGAASASRQPPARRLDVEGLSATVQRRSRTPRSSGTMAPPRRFVPSRDGYWDGFTYTIDSSLVESWLADVARHRRSTTGWGS